MVPKGEIIRPFVSGAARGGLLLRGMSHLRIAWILRPIHEVLGEVSLKIGIIEVKVRKDRPLADEGLGVKNIHAVQIYEPFYNELLSQDISFFYSRMHVRIENRVYFFIWLMGEVSENRDWKYQW